MILIIGAGITGIMLLFLFLLPPKCHQTLRMYHSSLKCRKKKWWHVNEHVFDPFMFKLSVDSPRVVLRVANLLIFVSRWEALQYHLPRGGI